MRKMFNILFGISIEKSKINKHSEEACYSRDELKEVLNRLYKCRDLEISNLWQRSVFLSVFMVLCFSGYGYLLLQIIDVHSSVCPHLGKVEYLNIAAISLGCLSVIFSLLWICMAKASKAWYEVYETAISAFENEHYCLLKIPEYNIMGEMGLPRDKLSSCLYSAKAGAFSPSRINIAIGQVCLTVWILVIILHFIFLNQISISVLCLPIIFVIMTFIIALCLIFSRWIKSGHLSNNLFSKNGRYIKVE